MPGLDLDTLELADAAQLIASKDMSPLELTTAYIARIERLEPRIDAFITQTFDLALESARTATDEIAGGRYRGPLHGVPFALKDLYETAGIRTTAGSPIRDAYVPGDDAFVVSKLRDAGIVLMGKLNMHEWALGGTNINVFYPSPHNPWDAERITGGSSGGSGAAIAASMCLGTLGSDTRGSIRIPASLCGITGLKPTYGRVSLRGVVPLIWSLDHAGPMAHTARDCALILQAIAGYDDDDPLSIDMPVPDFSATLDAGVAGLRIGLPSNFFFDAEVMQPEVIEAVRAAAQVFEALGAKVVPVEFPDPIAFGDNGAFLSDAAAYHENDLRDRLEDYEPIVRARLQTAQGTRGTDYSRARYRQLAMKRAYARLLREVDLVLTPTCPIVAPRLTDDPGPLQFALVRNTGPFNAVGAPVISLPCGFSSEGLPIGLSIAGRDWQEALVLQAAHTYQQATDWHRKRPAL